MEVKKVTVYSFSELSEAARERACQDYVEEFLNCFKWYEAVEDDFKRIGDILGLKVDNIYFSLYCQGEGACFEGSYRYAPGSVLKIKEYAPTDKRLHTIAENLALLQRRHFYQLEAEIMHCGNCENEYCTRIEVYHRNRDVDEVTQDHLAELLRDLMRWLYIQLQKEYEWQCSEECIAEISEINEWRYLKNGEFYYERT